MPLVDEAAVVDGPLETATNNSLPYVTEVHLVSTGSVLVVQVMPSVDEAATDE